MTTCSYVFCARFGDGFLLEGLSICSFFFPERREYFPNPCLSLPPITGANVILSIKSLTVLFSFLLNLCIHLYIYIYPFINVQWGRFKLKSYILKYALFALFAAFFSSKMLPLFIWLQGSLYLIHFTLIYCCYLAQITMQYAWGPGDIYIYLYIKLDYHYEVWPEGCNVRVNLLNLYASVAALLPFL